MKKIILLMGLLLFGSQVFAFNIVYPSKNDVIINANSTFFIGSSDKPLKINGQDVPLHPLIMLCQKHLHLYDAQFV